MTKDLILVAVSLFTWGLGEGIFIYFQPLYLQKLGASPVAIGGILGIASLVLAISQIPVGYLGDKIGRRPFLYLSWVLATLATWMMASASSLNWFVVGLIVYGLTGFVTPPLNSYVTEARGKWSVARALTSISAAYNLGMVAGPFIGGKIAEIYGLQSTYLVATYIFVVSTILIFFISKQPVHNPGEQSQSISLLRNQRFIHLLVMIFLVVFSTYLSQGLSPNFLQNEHGLSYQTIGLLGSIGSMGSTVLAFSLGLLHTRRGYLAAQAAVFVFTLALWLGTGLPWFLVGYFFMGGYKVCRSLSMALSRPIIHSSQMGVAYGFVETISSLAIFLAPTIAGLLYSVQPGMMYPVSAVCILFAIGFSWRYLRSYHFTPDEVMITPERSPD